MVTRALCDAQSHQTNFKGNQMKVRKIKHKTMQRMTNPSWEVIMSNNTPFHTRHIKPCKSYSPWCADCNSVLFLKTMGRFPHTKTEADEFAYRQERAAMEGEIK